MPMILKNQFAFLSENEQELGVALQAFADLIFILDFNGSILDCKFEDSHLHIQLSGTFEGRTIQEILPPNVANTFEHDLSIVRQGGKALPFEFSLSSSNREYWFDARLTLFSPSHIILLARDITNHKRTESRIQQQVRQLSALRSIDLAIASGLDLKLLLSMLLDQVTSLLRVDAASILLLNTETNTLNFSSGKGFDTSMLQHTHLKLGEGCAGAAALERKMVNIPDLAANKVEFDRAPLFARERFVVYYGMPLVAKGRTLGVLEIFHRSPLHPDGDWLDFLNIISGQAAIAIDSAVMFKDLQRSNVELGLAYDATIEGWVRTLDMRDKETEGHTRRVTEMTVRLASAVGIEKENIVNIRRGAILHDIGKVAIPDYILFKPGPLTAEEWKIMRQHPVIAADLLSPINHLSTALEIPRWHHEKWNGTGYPDGLRGDQIPFSARLFALADVYDALTSDRPYRKAWSKQDSLHYIEDQSGRYFDPKLVPEFLKMIKTNGHEAPS
jgi:HD-GYP domain-containing protein (c-di-GMP phosphodiesterase class II)